MYNLDDDVRNEPAQGSGAGMFAEGVKFKRMTCDDSGEVRFRILPAHHPLSAQQRPDGSIAVDPASWITFRDENNKLTAWGRKIYVAQFVGHGGKGTGVRRSIISLTSYSGATSGEVYCPLVTLLGAIRHEQTTWGYLTKDKMSQDGKTVVESKAISSVLAAQLLCNIVDVGNVQDGVLLGVFSKSAYDKLLSPEGGLAYQRNAAASPEEVAKNPMAQRACGDITHPTYGPVLLLTKEQQTDKSRKFRGYTIGYVSTPTSVLRLPVGVEVLTKRHNLLDLPTLIPKPTEEQIVSTLVEVLNGLSPSGEHEYELLRHDFGSAYRIPQPPARAYSPGLGSAPGSSLPAAPPQMVNVAPPPMVNVAPPPMNTGVSAVPPMYTPPSQPTGVPPPAPMMPAPVAASPVPPMYTPPQGAPQPQQPVPGDQVPDFNRDAFLKKLKDDATPRTAK